MCVLVGGGRRGRGKGGGIIRSTAPRQEGPPPLASAPAPQEAVLTRSSRGTRPRSTRSRQRNRFSGSAGPATRAHLDDHLAVAGPQCRPMYLPPTAEQSLHRRTTAATSPTMRIRNCASAMCLMCSLRYGRHPVQQIAQAIQWWHACRSDALSARGPGRRGVGGWGGWGGGWTCAMDAVAIGASSIYENTSDTGCLISC